MNMPPSAAPAPHARQLPLEAIARLHEGNKIEAIRIVRKAHGTQLKDAKDAVDAYVRTQPVLQQLFATRLAETKARLNRALLIALALLAAYLLMAYAP